MEIVVLLSNENLTGELFLEEKKGYIEGELINFNKNNLEGKIIMIKPFKDVLEPVIQRVQKECYLAQLSGSSFLPTEPINLYGTGHNNLVKLTKLEIKDLGKGFSLYGKFEFNEDLGLLVYEFCYNRLFLFSKITLLGEFVENNFYTSEIIAIDLFLDSTLIKNDLQLELN